MRIDYVFLCDAATEQGGKMNALGIGIDRLSAATFPATHARLTFAAKLSFDHEDAGSHHFRVRVVDADGREIGSPIEGKLNVAFAEGRRSTGANLLVDLLNIEFQAPGPHEISLNMDAAEIVALPLEVQRGKKK